MNQPVIRTIDKMSPEYPERLRNIPDPPKLLYVIGSLPEDDRPSCAIVGARMCDHYGSTIARQYGRILASHGIRIISGMAIGIDSTAQAGALEGKGRTYAVLGCGVDICYPPGSRALYESVAASGGIISELPPGTPPKRWNFPLRNRIISGLADLVLVVEAKSKSGSLITADYALEQGRTVYAVPGRVGDALSDGCNNLIAQGAGIASSPEILLSEFDRMHETLSFASGENRLLRARRQKERRVLENSTLPAEAKNIYRILSWSESMDISKMIEQSGLPVSSVNASLMRLILAGYVVEESPGRYLKEL